MARGGHALSASKRARFLFCAAAASLRAVSHALEHNILRLENRIMSAIQDFATAQTAAFDRMDTAIAGIQTEIAALKAAAVSPADQALLDGLASRASATAGTLETVAAPAP